MSAYKRIQCSLVDKDTLIEALKQLGLSPKVFDEPQKLRGYMGDARSEAAEIIIERRVLDQKFTGASNDLGFRWNSDAGEYEMICSDYDKSCQIDSRVMQMYAKVAVEKALKAQGFKVTVNTPQKDLVQRRNRAQVHIQGRKLI